MNAGNDTDCLKTRALSSALRVAFYFFLAESSAALPSVWHVLDTASCSLGVGSTGGQSWERGSDGERGREGWEGQRALGLNE